MENEDYNKAYEIYEEYISRYDGDNSLSWSDVVEYGILVIEKIREEKNENNKI